MFPVEDAMDISNADKLADATFNDATNRALTCLRSLEESGLTIHPRGMKDPVQYMRELSRVRDEIDRIQQDSHRIAVATTASATCCVQGYKLRDLQDRARSLKN